MLPNKTTLSVWSRSSEFNCIHCSAQSVPKGSLRLIIIDPENWLQTSGGFTSMPDALITSTETSGYRYCHITATTVCFVHKTLENIEKCPSQFLRVQHDVFTCLVLSNGPKRLSLLGYKTQKQNRSDTLTEWAEIWIYQICHQLLFC